MAFANSSRASFAHLSASLFASLLNLFRMANGTSLESGRIDEIGLGGRVVICARLVGQMFGMGGHLRRE